MGSENRSISRYETTAVYTHPEAKVDIVLVHGLNGDPEKTWRAKNGVFWPLDLLPTSLRDAHANVMVYGYNADVYSKKNDRSASDNFIHHHSQTLITNLTLFRRSEGVFKNPIIWVCHSLGGILVKKALLYSNDLRAEDHEDYRSIYVSTYGLIFLGTPHTGSDGAKWGLVLQAMSDAIVLKRFFDSESVLLKTLKRDNETLSNINSHFLDIYQRFKIHMAHENYKTDIKGTKTIVVDVNSASPQLPGVTYYGIEATHGGMCKFDGPTAPGYRNVSAILRKWIYDAPARIQVRWEVEETERRARARNEIAERIRPYMTSPGSDAQGSVDQDPLISIRDQTTTEPLLLGASEPPLPVANEPLFVHPERFRPNSYFKGRSQELADLHRMLHDRDRRAQGTSAVVIRSIPGGGKSHLAREYAFRFRHEYPGGVFWVRGKSQEDLEEGFLKMAQNTTIRQGIQVEKEADLQDSRKAVRLIRKWLNQSDNWLLILDGVLHDTPSISRFVPDAKNTSLILTSTDSSIADNHKFDDPQKLELGPLSMEEAQELLLEEMGKNKPWSQEDLNRAHELVKLMECNPLTIHMAARQLRATKEPLSKYIRSYKSRPRTGGLNAYRAVREKLQERGEMASLNLIYLLSFFNEQLPVEMLSLGLKALDKRTPVRTRDSSGKRSLNKTFTVLIAFALVDRDEVDDAPSISTYSSSQNSKHAQSSEPLDVLSIQSFVQNFFLEALKKEDQFSFWLERAAAVLCKSYDEADIFIQRHPEVGLPNDYRRYGSHFRRLLKHVDRVDRPSQELRRVQQALLARFGDVQEQINIRSKNVVVNATVEAGDGPYVSVFERTNSWSVSSSTTTVESDDDTRPIPQRTLSHPYGNIPTLDLSPHTHHAPYPSGDTIPGPYFVDDDDGGDWMFHSPQAEEQPGLEPHRTVRKMAQKRYHDRAGAWRETREKVNEPRVSISKEVASARFSPVLRTSSPGGTSSMDFRGAQEQLQHIKTAFQRNPDFKDVYGDNGKTSSADNVEEQTQHSGSRSQRLDSFSPHGTTQAPIMSRFNSQQKASQSSIPTVDENPFFEGSNNDMITRPFQPYDEIEEWRPAASAGYTSMQSMGTHSDSHPEMESERWQVSGLPIVVNQTSSLSPAPNYHGNARIDHRSFNPGHAQGGMSNSLPNSYTDTLQPPAWRPVPSNPDGYTSQPMSRNPSASNPELHASHHSSPIGSTATSQTLPINTNRAPSMAATEPSPRLHGLDAVPTSYQVWQQRHADPWSPGSRGSSPMSQSRRPLSRDSGDVEAVEMERTGSGGIRVDGRIVQFGQSPPRGAPYPREILEADEEVMSSGGGSVGLGIIEEHGGR